MADLEVNRRLKNLIMEVYKTTPHKFSKKYNDNGGVKTSQIMRERNGVSSEMIELICGAYPEINKTWLLTGEGKPIITDSSNSGVIQSGDGVNVNGVNSGSIVNDHRQYTSESPDVLRHDIERLETIITEKETRIREKDTEIAKKDEQIAKKDEQIAKKDEQIDSLLEILKKK